MAQILQSTQLDRLPNILQELKLAKNYIKRVYVRDNAIGIDLIESESHKHDFYNKNLFLKCINGVHVFPIHESRYREGDQVIFESIIDSEKKVLNPNLWDSNNKLIPSVKEQVLAVANDIIAQFSKETGIPLTMGSVYLTGSNLGYYYNTYTDVDVHFMVDEFSEEIQSLMATFIDKNFKDKTFIEKHPVEFYLMDKSQEAKRDIGGIYEVQEDKWIVQSEKIPMEADEYNACLQIALHYARKFDMIDGELKRDIIEYRLQDDLEDELAIQGERPKELRDTKWIEIKSNVDAIVLEFDALKAMRKTSFEDGFEQGDVTVTNVQSTLDRSFTTNNIVFKILDRYGYIPFAKKFKYDIQKRMIEDSNMDDHQEQYIDDISNVIKLNMDEVK